MKKSLALVAILSLVFLPVTPAFAAERTWTGAGGDNNWSTPDNWGGVAPNPDDALIFTGSLGDINVNDYADNTQFSDITFDSEASSFNILATPDHTIALNGDITNNSSNSQALNLDLSLVNDAAFNAAAGDMLFNGAININAHTLTVTGDSDVGSSSQTVISGSGGLTKNGAGTLTLSAANSYQGITVINAGTIKVDDAAALGTLDGGTTVNANGTLDLNGLMINAEALTLNGGSLTNSGNSLNSVMSNVITLADDSSIGGTGDILLGGVIDDGVGDYGLTKVGDGTLELNGANAYTGATAINVGTVKLGHATGLGTTDAGTSVTSGAALDLNGQAVGGEAVTINGTGVSSGGALLNSSASAASLSGMVTLGSASTIMSSGAGGLTLTGGITNGGFDVAFDGANATTVSTTKITGSGGLVKNGSGTLTLSAANDYTGTTTINAGTLELSGGSAIANTGAVSLANVSGAILKLGANETIGSLSGGGTTGGNVNLQTFTLTTGDSNDTAYGGVISGTGGLTKAGSGVFTLTNANTYSGTTTISAGTLQVGSGGTTGALGTGAVTNHAALVFNRSDAVTVSNVISGSGMLRQSGSGILTLSSANLYSGGTTIDAGKTLAVSNASALGSGTVANGGTLDLGTTALNLGAGAYNQTGTLTFTVNSASVGDFGAISSTGGNVTGTITPIVSGYLANNDTLAIINGNGSLTYDAATVLTPYSHYTFTGSQSGGILTLTASRAENGFASDAGGNSNSAAVGSVLDNISGASGDMLNVLNTLDGMSAGAVGTSLGTMTPDVSSGAAEGSRSLTSQGFTMVSNRLGGARTGGGMSGSSGVSSGEMTEGLGVWMQGLGSNMKQKERKGIEGYSANIFGTTIGADKVLDRHFRAGLAGSYGYANVKSKTPGSPSDNINSYQATLYGSYDSLDLCEARQGGKKSPEAVRTQVEDSWYVDGMLAFTQNNYDSRREIWVGSSKRVAKADHYGQQYSTNFETGYKFVFEETKDLEVTPFAGLGYNYLYLNKYKEKGADALNLHVEGEGFHQLEQSLGMKLAYPIVNKKLGTFIPSGKAAWLYDYIGDRFETTANFAGGGASFDTVGAKPAKSGMLFGAELAFLNKGNMTVTGNWDIEIKDEFLSNTYYGTVRYDF